MKTTCKFLFLLFTLKILTETQPLLTNSSPMLCQVPLTELPKIAKTPNIKEVFEITCFLLHQCFTNTKSTGCLNEKLIFFLQFLK